MEVVTHGRRGCMSKLVLGISFCILVLSICLVCYQNYKERKSLNRLNRMLERAIDGDYQELNYDETLLSAVEARMARFLSSSKLSYKQVEEERDKIKTLISDISHQTKTPIANIRLFSDILLEEELPNKARQATEKLSEQAEKLQFLIGALVKMSRLENGIIKTKPIQCSVEELITGVYNGILPKAEKKKIEVTKEPTDILAFYDSKWTSEALYNLLDNAVKYTAFGGKIKICAKAYEMFCRIDVIDSGIGILEAEQGKIFTRFYRSSDVTAIEGVGVGLYLAREIIASQNGYIRVQSEKGKGSIFSIYLPM